MTLTGLAADGSAGRVRRRRVCAVLAMLGGALAGGLLVRLVAAAAPLWLASAVLGCCALMVYVMARRPEARSWR
jgi:predicted MFS family arabinose efflux permease